MSGEEGGYEEHIDRYARRARHEGDHQHRQRPILRVLDAACRHDSRYVAAEAYQHRDERTSVQAYGVHDLIHQEGRTSHITRVLHQRQQDKENQDIGHEG